MKKPKPRFTKTTKDLPKKTDPDTVVSGTPEYDKAYAKRGLAKSYDATTDTYDMARMLDEVVVTDKNKGTFEQDIRDARTKTLTGALELMGEPQKRMMQGITGKMQTPSQAWGYNEPSPWEYIAAPGVPSIGNMKDVTNFVMDAVADPTNLLGAGLVDDVLRIGGRQALGKGINNAAQKAKTTITHDIANVSDVSHFNTLLARGINKKRYDLFPPKLSDVQREEIGTIRLIGKLINEKTGREGLKDALKYADKIPEENFKGLTGMTKEEAANYVNRIVTKIDQNMPPPGRSIDLRRRNRSVPEELNHSDFISGNRQQQQVADYAAYLANAPRANTITNALNSIGASPNTSNFINNADFSDVLSRRSFRYQRNRTNPNLKQQYQNQSHDLQRKGMEFESRDYEAFGASGYDPDFKRPNTLLSKLNQKFSRSLEGKQAYDNMDDVQDLLRDSGFSEHALKVGAGYSPAKVMLKAKQHFEKSSPGYRAVPSMSLSSDSFKTYDMTPNFLKKGAADVDYAGMNQMNEMGFLSSARVNKNLIVADMNETIDKIRKASGKKIPNAYADPNGTVMYPAMIINKKRHGGKMTSGNIINSGRNQHFFAESFEKADYGHEKSWPNKYKKELLGRGLPAVVPLPFKKGGKIDKSKFRNWKKEDGGKILWGAPQSQRGKYLAQGGTLANKQFGDKTIGPVRPYRFEKGGKLPSVNVWEEVYNKINK